MNPQSKRSTRFRKETFELIAARFQLLAEPARLRILHMLTEGEKNVGEIIRQTGLEQANASKHLALLLREGIVGRRKSGLFVYYFITDPTVFRLCDVVCKGLEKKFLQASRTLNRYQTAGSV